MVDVVEIPRTNGKMRVDGVLVGNRFADSRGTMQICLSIRYKEELGAKSAESQMFKPFSRKFVPQRIDFQNVNSCRHLSSSV